MDSFSQATEAHVSPKPSGAPSSGPGIGRSSTQVTRTHGHEEEAQSPQITSLTTDAVFRFSIESDGRVSIGAGIGGPIETKGGRVGLQIGDRQFTVETTRGQSASQALDRLAGQIVRARFPLEVGGFTIDTINEQWTIGPNRAT